MTTATTIDPAILETLPESFPAEEVCISIYYPTNDDLKDPDFFIKNLFETFKVLDALDVQIDDMDFMFESFSRGGYGRLMGLEYNAKNDAQIKLLAERFTNFIYRDEQERFQETVEADLSGAFEEAGLDVDDLPENLIDYYDLQADEGGEQFYVRKSI